ncbi:AAA family ATPase [Capnocytophaga cynodegmi]|uniref:AAA family ATPase n=1 Tax=Capnocytophaga cynodegmi TaxID=28189 RepID=UPI00385F70C6
MEKIIKGLEIWENWKEDYKKFVPRFIEEAKTKSRWQDWDKDVFYEYFERSKGQCVSSLKQGYFSNEEKEEIKQNWETEIAPILKKIAESQETLRINLYRNLDNVIRQHTSQHRRAAVNRLIAGLQPKILCTIINPKDLNKAKKLINNLLPKNKKIKDNDYFEISNRVIELIKETYPNDNVYDLVTIPWQLYETLSNKQIVENKEDMNLEKTLDLLKYKKQIILQGPPGTGKTREAKELAKTLLKLKKEEDLKNNDQFQIIQFHPSYSYEDFVRGIVAKPNSNGDGITYEAENKILAKFAKKALENYQNSQKDVQTLSEENKVLKYFEAFKDDLNDKIEENNGFNLTESVILLPLEDEDAFRYKGKGEIGWSQGKGLRMLHNDILQAHFDGNTSRQDIKKNQNLSGLARQHASYYIRVLNLFQKFIEDNPNLIKEEKPENDLKNFVLIIDEINRANLSSVLGELIYALEYRGEAVDSMYEVDGSNKIILPPNLYIIGTMNTADRSVGHIDYAIRRRFAFVDMFPKDLSQELGEHFAKDKFIAVSELFIKDFDLNKDYSKEKIEKSDYLSNEFDVKDVWLGHSYFIEQYEKDNNGEDIKDKPIDFRIRLEYEIKPILREYVKDGVLKESASKEIDNL